MKTNLLSLKSYFEGFVQYVKLTLLRWLNSRTITNIIIVLTFVASGYALSIFVDQVIRAIAALLALTLATSLYIGEMDINLFLFIKEKKRIPFFYPSLILFLFFGFSTIATMIFNNDTVNVVGYLIHGLLVTTAFMITKAVSFSVFKDTFRKYVFVLSLLALFFHTLSRVSNIDFGLFQFTNTNGSIYSNYFFIFFQNIHLDRLQSIFWEPGLYSSFILIALFFEVIDEKKLKLFRVFVLVLCLLLTRSTFAYLTFLLIVILYLHIKIIDKKIRMIFFLIIILSVIGVFLYYDDIISLLVKVLPSIFGKIQESNVSLTTRLISPLVNIEIFKDSFLFGVGFSNSFALYPIKIIEMGFNGMLDSQTSTSTFFLAVFGLPGLAYTIPLIYGPLSFKKMDYLSKILLSLLFIVIINKEPHYGILLTFVFMFYFTSEGFDKRVREKNKHNYQDSGVSIKNYFKKQGASQKLYTNIILSLLLKGGALIVGFFSIRVFSRYFDEDTTFGVWLAILSILSWVMTFDLGLGNGLKNKLIESMSKEDNEKGKRLVSSTYFSTILISLVIFVIGAVLVFLTDLNKLFGVSPSIISLSVLRLVSLITLFGITIEFVFKNILYVYHAMQKQYLSGFFPLISSLIFMLFAIFAKGGTPSERLVYLATAYAIIHSMIYLIPTFYLFSTQLKAISPSLKEVRRDSINDVMSLGIAFFIIQLTLLVINSTDTIFISNLYGPEKVVEYTYYSKIFLIISSVFIIIGGTIWASIKKAFIEGKLAWIKKIQRQFIYLAIVSSILTIATISMFQVFINLWLEEFSFNVNYFIVLVFVVQTIFTFFISVFSAVSNGIQTLKSQLIAYLLGGVLKIVLTYTLASFLPNPSWIIVIIAHIISYIPFLIIVPIANAKKLNESEVPL